MFRRRWALADALVLGAVAFLIVVASVMSAGGRSSDTQTRLSVRPAAPGRPVPAGFLGLSLEYPAVERYAGTDPTALNPVFLQLVRNIAGPAPMLRIGGDSADWTWWPVAQLSRPPGVTYSLTPRWLAVTRRLTDALDARLMLGLNLEADSTDVALAEASALSGALGRSAVQAYELGNEPELYGAFPWYRTASGQPVYGRSRGYGFSAFTQDVTRFAAALPNLPLAGPAVSGPRWTQDLGRFIAAEPQLHVVTLHHYPLQLCFAPRSSPAYPTVAHLLTGEASTGLAQRFAPGAAIANAHGLPLRVDELNTVSCGADAAVSQTFASALWALDTLFEMVRAGVDGVNIHTFPGAGYDLFSFTEAHGRWTATVAPEYYGLLMFAQATPPGSRLLSVSGAQPAGLLKTWATIAPDGRVRFVAINKDTLRPRVVSLRTPRATGSASLERLKAPSAASASPVTLAGWSFGSQTETGLPAPRPARLGMSGGRFVVSLPPGSAALLTVPVR